MAGVNAKLNVAVDLTSTTPNDLGDVTFKTLLSNSVAIFPGTEGIDEADLTFADSRTLAASATENLDLAGTLSTPDGGVFTAAEIVAIYVKANEANTNDVVIGGASSNGFEGPLGATGTYAVPPGECVLMVSKKGWPVTAGTGDLLKIANSGAGTSVSFNILIIGRSVAA